MTLTTTTTQTAKLDTTPSWKDISDSKIHALNTSIPEEWRIPEHLLPPKDQADVTQWPEISGWFTKDELAITSLTAAELLKKLASGNLTCEHVTKAFCKRACAAHRLVTAQTQQRIDVILTT
jgi:amidase